MSRRGAWAIRLCLSALLLLTATAIGGADDGALIEASLMARLAAAQSAPGATLKPFATDGCSGGMSAGWEHMARTFPRYAHLLGGQPPWEHCCVVHDHAYWQGRGEGGAVQRLAADRALRQCVITVGQAQAPIFAHRLKIPVAAARDAFRASADLMFAAVRVGGLPCTHLSWRWGYGWPECERNEGLPELEGLSAKAGR